MIVEYFLAGDDTGNASGTNKQLFLSYGHEPEVNSFVWQLKQDLERRGFTVWLDVDIAAGIANL